MAFTTKYLNFLFFLISLFLVALADTISVEPSPESQKLWGFMFVHSG